MLQSVSRLDGASIRATNGAIGSVDQFLFDDESWAIRYLVVDTGGWLPGRLVLITPIAVRTLDWEGNRVDVVLTREQVKGSPDISLAEPVSRQKEREYFAYYGYAPYWVGAGLWGAGVYPGYLGYPPANPAPDAVAERNEPVEEEPGDPHLRSTDEVRGYTIQAEDGTIGHVDDFIMDDESWAIRYLVIDTRDWLPGKKVLISPQWIEGISWEESAVHVGLSRAQIESAPEYDPSHLISREYESELHDYYERSPYWKNEGRSAL